jgi:hypothetical protein
LRAFGHPGEAWKQVKEHLADVRYRRTGTYLEEEALLRLSRDRGRDGRRAEVCSCWKEIKALPGISSWPIGITNLSPSLTNHSLERSWTVAFAASRFDFGLEPLISRPLWRIADSEVMRRLLVTAVALERQGLQRCR